MKTLPEHYTVAEVDDLISEIERHTPGLRQRAESGECTAAKRAGDMKLDAMCRALERRAELQNEIQSGLRSPDGSLNAHV